jgi:hypothetical protein
MSISRRGFLGLVPAMPFFSSQQLPQLPPPNPRFPSHDDESVREIVSVAHGNLARVKEMVTARPALARASWDWGFGDWETPIDAASHVGNRPIAEFLIANGARPTVFTAVMLGQLSIVKSLVDVTPGLQRMRGPHGLTMVAHAKAGGSGSVEVLKYLESLGDADPRYPDVALTEAEQAAIVGEYSFGPDPGDRFRVAKGPRGFTIQRPGGAERNLFHHGRLVFNPPGAEAVQIRFDGDSVIVEDGARITRGRRI